jgi:hypothetical protein
MNDPIFVVEFIPPIEFIYAGISKREDHVGKNNAVKETKPAKEFVTGSVNTMC